MALPFDLIDEAKRLIRFNTVTWSSNADCAVYVGSLFRKLGLQVSYQEARVGEVLFMNVVGWVGTGKAPLLLTTHLDTVDPGNPRLWTKTGADPWRLTVRGDTLTGLGAADTKLDLLAKLAALGGMKVSALARPIVLLGTFGEESGLRGAARFCQGDLPRPAMALVGEPSDLSVVTRHKGLAVGQILFKTRGLLRPSSAQWLYEATLTGKAAHSSTPGLGANAIELGLQLLQSLKKRHGKIALLSWEGGSGHNIIPASSTIRFSLGDHPRISVASSRPLQLKVSRLQPGWYPTLPLDDLLWSVETLRALLDPAQKEKDHAFKPPTLTWNTTLLQLTPEGWCLTFDVRPLPGQSIQRFIKSVEARLWKKMGHPGPTWQFRLERDNPALDLERHAPLVKMAGGSCRAARLPFKIEAKAGCSEAGLYARVGIPSVVFGPGRAAGNIHQPNESVSLRQVKKAIRFYQEFIKRACF